jgi:SAM-dependent methyltransferase
MQTLDEMKPQQSPELLKSLHILTRDGKINQDSRRKLKQVYHLYNFIEPILEKINQENERYSIVDHGCGKSYLGFILYDLFIKSNLGQVIGVETRSELVEKSKELAEKLKFDRMHFINAAISNAENLVPNDVDMVTALHACDTATDDAIFFGLKRNVKYFFLVPCCQAEVAKLMRKNKSTSLTEPIAELWRHPIHTREVGSHLTNVLRCLLLESQGYKLTVTELVGWEHSMKNELIIAQYVGVKKGNARERGLEILKLFNLQELESKFII